MKHLAGVLVRPRLNERLGSKILTPIVLDLACDLQSLRMPNNSEMRWCKDDVYESLIDTLFLSQVPLHPNVVLVFILLSYYLLHTCIWVTTVNTA